MPAIVELTYVQKHVAELLNHVQTHLHKQEQPKHIQESTRKLHNLIKAWVEKPTKENATLMADYIFSDDLPLNDTDLDGASEKPMLTGLFYLADYVQNYAFNTSSDTEFWQDMYRKAIVDLKNA